MEWLGVLRPSGRRWAWAAGGRAVLAGGIVLVVGLTTRQWSVVGVVYFGAACAVVFALGGTGRSRLLGVVSQAGGASVGLLIGAASAGSAVAVPVCAAALGLLSGMVGLLGPRAAAAATMAVVGLAYGQFADTGQSTVALIGWYLVGSALVFAIVAGPALWAGGLEVPAAASAVQRAAADLLRQVGTATPEQLQQARDELASASAVLRSAWYDARWGGRFERTPALRRRREQVHRAERAALLAAALARRGEVVAPQVIDAVSGGADLPDAAVLGLSDAVWVTTPALPGIRARLSGAVRQVVSSRGLLAGARLALCMTAAALLTTLLHEPSHSFWISLTVAVVVRPEYGSVWARTVNRVVGTVVGALLAALCLLLLPGGWPLAVGAAVALGVAVAGGPKLYAVSVVGVTCSALLSASVAHPDPVTPVTRLADTVVGALIAIVLGYLVFPVNGRSSLGTDLTAARVAVRAYLSAVTADGGGDGSHPTDPDARKAARDGAYLAAHRLRRSVQDAAAELPPINHLAATTLPTALDLETLVDDIAELELETATGNAILDRAAALAQRVSRA